MKLTGPIALASLAVTALAVTFTPPQLQVRVESDLLHISAPQLNFLSGKNLERLKDGASVAFLGQLTVSTERNAVVPDARSVARFAMSYDIWEERFSATKMGDRLDNRRTVSHLSARAAETWVLENLTIDRSLLPPEKPFYVQLDLRTEDPKDQAGIIGEPGINLTRLIELFSRPVKSAQPRWLLNNGPYRLTELRRSTRL